MTCNDRAHLQTRPATMLLFLLLALAPQSRGLTVVSEACARYEIFYWCVKYFPAYKNICRRCQQPEFPPGSGRALYLPHCVDGVSRNYCDAVCTGLPVRYKHDAVGVNS